MAALITLDTYKQQNSVSEAFNIQELFNARVGDEQVPFPVKFLERGKAQQFEDGLVPFMSGFVGNLDDDGKVTAETGEPVSYTGSRDDIVGLGMVKMNLPGTMFPQEGYFYGFLGLETPDHSKRVSTFSVWFHVYNGNPDMFVNKEPFRTELQKLLDESEIKIENEIGNVKTEWEDLQAKILDMIKQGNIDITSLNTRIGLAEDRLAQYEKDLAAGKGVSQSEFEDIFDDFKDDVKKELGDFKDHNPLATYFEDETNEVGGPIPSYYQNKLNQMSSIPKDNFNVGFITDAHLQLDNYAPNSVAHYAYIAAASRRARLDAIVAGGDNTNGWWEKNQKLVETRHATSTLFNRTAAGTDVFFQMGNHDTGINQNGHNTPDTCLSESEIKAMYHTADLMYGEVRDGDSLYGYKDYPDKKVRVIWLNSFDLPFELNDDGTYKYDFLRQPSYRNQQLTWLAEKALKIPDNKWQVMVFTHAPLPNTFGVIPIEFNSDILIGILNAFQGGKAYALKDTTREMPVDINVDFSTQGASVLIGLFTGHIHEDGQMLYSNINCVETACSLCYSGDSKRARGTETEDCWDIFSVDTVNRKIHAYRFGYGTDRNFGY
jgi:UDP-2,3-diacylglucosamine pyrophosphatase LpxH